MSSGQRFKILNLLKSVLKYWRQRFTGKRIKLDIENWAEDKLCRGKPRVCQFANEKARMMVSILEILCREKGHETLQDTRLCPICYLGTRSTSIQVRQLVTGHYCRLEVTSREFYCRYRRPLENIILARNAGDRSAFFIWDPYKNMGIQKGRALYFRR